MFFNTLVFVSLVSLFSSGCKKKEEGSPPTVQYHTPLENATYTVFDNIQISAHVYSATAITDLKIGIVNDQMVPVMSTIPLSPVTHIAFTYNIYDIHLTSGTYYVWISATNADNLDVNAYQKISISEAPKKRKAVYVITKLSSSQLGLTKADSVLNSQQQVGSFNGDFSGSAISSWHQQLYLAGNYTGDHRAIELAGHSIKWSVPYIGSSNPYFTGVSSDEKSNYLSYFGGQVKALDQNGSTRYFTTPSGGYYPLKSFVSGSYLLQEQKDYTSSQRKLVVYYSSSGVGKQETLIPETVTELFTKDADNVYLFGNASGQAKMEIYTVSGNSFWNRTLPAGTLAAATQVNSDTYLLAYTNGTIYKYTYSNNSLITWLSGVNAVKLRYDEVNGEVCIAELKKLSSYDLNSSGLKKTLTVPDTILDMHILFNR